MEQNHNGMLAVLAAAGEKIEKLEDDLRYALICRENAECRAAQLEEENKHLRTKINAIESYAERLGN